jgi:hypothetical protein
MAVANAVSGFMLLMLIINSGFIIARGSLPPWTIYFYWVSPFAYSIRALVINEFTSPRWQSLPSVQPGKSLGDVSLGLLDFYTDRCSLSRSPPLASVPLCSLACNDLSCNKDHVRRDRMPESIRPHPDNCKCKLRCTTVLLKLLPVFVHASIAFLTPCPARSCACAVSAAPSLHRSGSSSISAACALDCNIA